MAFPVLAQLKPGHALLGGLDSSVTNQWRLDTTNAVISSTNSGGTAALSILGNAAALTNGAPTTNNIIWNSAHTASIGISSGDVQISGGSFIPLDFNGTTATYVGNASGLTNLQGANVVGAVATAIAATTATNLYAGTVIFSNPPSYAVTQAYSTNTSAQILNFDFNLPNQVLLITNNTVITNAIHAPANGLSPKLLWTVVSSNYTLTLNNSWHGAGPNTAFTNGNSLTGAGQLYKISFDATWLPMWSSNAYTFTVIPFGQ